MPHRFLSIAAMVTLAVSFAPSRMVAQAADTNGELTVHVDQPGATIGPMFYGLMTEEINHSYDGGLYAELIQNRIFKDARGRAPADPENPPHWSVVKKDSADGGIMLDTDNPVNKTALTTSLRLDSKGSGGRIGVANDGYWGIPVKPNTGYKVSFYAKASDGFKGPLKVAIESNDGAKEHATATIDGVNSEWKKYTSILKTGAGEASKDNRFVITAPGENKGSVRFNLVSLFPPTYKNRVNGNRVDIMEMLAGMKPQFLRFPGGNYVEGSDYAGRFNWKETIGPLEERPGHPCPWGYRSSDGLGLLEFLNWCEDLNMEPVLAVFAGFTLNGRYVAMGDQLKPFVQDALDEIEYVTGDASTEWGARRVQDGHPAPFKLTYVEIGNEDDLGGGQRTYNERFGAFYEAIKAKYPNLQIISTIKPNRNQPNFSNLSHKPDVVDDHMYSPAEGTMRNANRHDRFPRDSGVKVFMGEWATNGNGQGTPTPNLRAGLADAAFLGGLERNSDLVIMECYAPLFVNVNQGARQWPTNLIGYDGLTSFGSPSYYVQKMYRDNAGDRALPVELTNVEPLDKPEESSNGRPQGPPAPMYATALRDTASGDVVVRVINTESVPRAVKINLEGVSTVAKDATVDFLSGKPTEVNTLDDPKHIVPQQAKIDNAGTSFVHEFPGYSVSIVRLKTK